LIFGALHSDAVLTLLASGADRISGFEICLRNATFAAFK
jgi:hypothetical protein